MNHTCRHSHTVCGKDGKHIAENDLYKRMAAGFYNTVRYIQGKDGSLNDYLITYI